MKPMYIVLAALACNATAGHAGDTDDDLNRKVFQLRPLQFLQHLKTNCCEPVSVMDAPPNWVTKDDVIELSKYIGSEEKAAPVYSLASSIIPRHASTIGAEARFLIRGYHEQRYPPALHSGMTLTKQELPKK
jgi:hypothetical protein